VHDLESTPALRRLEWILDGLAGTPDWGGDAADVFAPEFAKWRSPHDYVALTRSRSARYAPLRIVGLETNAYRARARLYNHAGEVDVLTCSVELEPPHRITQTAVQGLIPARLSPRLPMTFEDYDVSAPGATLLVFAGVPGSGKSTLADATGRALGVPVFAVDWMLGALTPFGGRHLDDSFGIGYEQLTTLAVRQLRLGQSAILDAPVEQPRIRDRWRSLAERARARFAVVDCVCSDPAVHEARLRGRDRDIPGWHGPGDWANVQRRLREYPQWTDQVLTVDSVRPLADNVQTVLAFLDRPSAGRPSARS
jgi:predicted kinase